MQPVFYPYTTLFSGHQFFVLTIASGPAPVKLVPVTSRDEWNGQKLQFKIGDFPIELTYQQIVTAAILARDEPDADLRDAPFFLLGHLCMHTLMEHLDFEISACNSSYPPKCRGFGNLICHLAHTKDWVNIFSIKIPAQATLEERYVSIEDLVHLDRSLSKESSFEIRKDLVMSGCDALFRKLYGAQAYQNWSAYIFKTGKFVSKRDAGDPSWNLTILYNTLAGLPPECSPVRILHLWRLLSQGAVSAPFSAGIKLTNRARRLLEVAIQGCSNGSSELRETAHSLLLMSLETHDNQIVKTAFAAFPAILRGEPGLEERLRLTRRVSECMRFPSDIEQSLLCLAAAPLSDEEAQAVLLEIFCSIKREPFLSLAVEFWRVLPAAQKKEKTLSLFAVLKEHFPLLAQAVVKEAMNLPFQPIEIETMLQECWEVASKIKTAESQTQAIFGVAALLQNHPRAAMLAVKFLNESYQKGEQSMAFAIACQQRGLYPKGPLAQTAASLFPLLPPEGVPQPSQLMEDLCSLLGSEQEEHVVSLALHFLNVFIEKMPKGPSGNIQELQKRRTCAQMLATKGCTYPNAAIRSRGCDLLLRFFMKDREIAPAILGALPQIVATETQAQYFITSFLNEAVGEEARRLSFCMLGAVGRSLSETQLIWVEALTATRQPALCVIAAEIWNALPQEVKKERSISSLPALLANRFFSQSPQEGLSFAIRCEEVGLMPSGALANTVNALKSPEKISTQQIAELIGQVGNSWLSESDKTLADLHLHFLNYLIALFPQHEKHRRKAFETLLLKMAAQKATFAKELIDFVFRNNAMRSEPGNALLLLQCCMTMLDTAQGVREAASLFDYARERFWGNRNYEKDFEGFLTLNRLLRQKGLKNRQAQLRANLLAVSPEHEEINEELRLQKLGRLEKNLKGEPTPNHLNLLKQLLDLADPAQEQTGVKEAAEHVLPHLWKLTSKPIVALTLLVVLHDFYPQVSLVQALSAFPIDRASPDALKIYSNLLERAETPLPHSLQEPTKVCVQRLLAHKMYAEALQLLQATQLDDDGVWLNCMKAIANAPYLKLHEEALRSAEKRQKYAGFPEEPGQDYQSWWEFEQVRFKLLLLCNETHKEQLKNRIVKALNSADPLNMRFSSQQGLRLLTYMDLMLPDPPQRYAHLYSTIEDLRKGIAAVSLPSGEAGRLTALDQRLARCALHTKNGPAILAAVQLLRRLVSLEKMGGLKRKEMQESILIAIQQARPFLMHPELLEAVEKLSGEFRDRLAQGEYSLKVIEALNEAGGSLRVIAVAIALKLPLASFNSRDNIYKVYRGLIQNLASTPEDRKEIPKLLGVCAPFLSETSLKELLCWYLDALWKKRSDTSENPAVDTSGIELANAHLERLSPELQCQVLDKVFDHLLLFLVHHEGLGPWIQEAWTFLGGLETSHFQDVEGRPQNSELNERLKTLKIEEGNALFSPQQLYKLFVHHILNILAKRKQLQKPIVFGGHENVLEEKLQEIGKKFGGLQLLVKGKANDPIFFRVGQLLVTKCLQFSCKEGKCPPVIMALLSHRLQLLIENFPRRHAEWMPLVWQFFVHPLAFEDEKYFSLHELNLGIFTVLLTDPNHSLWRSYPAITYLLYAYYQHKPMEFNEMSKYENRRDAAVQFLEELEKTPKRFSHVRTRQFMHYACTNIFWSDIKSAFFRRWYERLILEMKLVKNHSKEEVKLLGHVSSDLATQGDAYLPCKLLHQKHCLTLLELFAEMLACHSDNTDALWDKAWEYLFAAQGRFATAEQQPEFDKKQSQLLAQAPGMNRLFLEDLDRDRATVHALLRRHGSALCALQSKLSDAAKKESAAALHQVWSEIVAKWIACLRRDEIGLLCNPPVIRAGGQTMMQPVEDLWRTTFKFLHSGVSFYSTSGAMEIYFQQLEEIGYVLLDRLPDHKFIYAANFASLFHLLTKPYPVIASEEALLPIRRQILGRLLQKIADSDSPYALAAASLYMVRKKGAQELYHGEELSVVRVLLDKIEAKVGARQGDLVGMLERLNPLG